MNRQLTFIHASDIHLGVSFKGLRAISTSWANRLVSAIGESYDRLVDAAINEEVDFVIISGDIFDSNQISYADYLHFLNGLDRLDEKGILVYVCTGNHDPYAAWQQEFSSMPANTTIFSSDKPSFSVYMRDGVPLAVLGGRSYHTQTWPQDKDIAEGITRQTAEIETKTTPPFVIGVIHTGLNIDKSQAPTDPKKLLAAGLDYWALGHIHERQTLPANNPSVVFPGCIQGRSINETGEKGVYKVTLKENGSNQLEFISTASVVWQQIDLDVSLCSSITEIGERIVHEMVETTTSAHCEEVCSRVTLRGKTSLHKLLKTPGVIEDLRRNINDSYPYFFCDAIVDRTSLPLNKQALAKEGLFPAVFLQASQQVRQDKAETIAYVQDEFLKKGLSLVLPQENDIDQALEDAENAVLDLLNQGEE